MTEAVWIAQHDDSPHNTILGVFASPREADDFAESIPGPSPARCT
ncbi:hypothetical protein [Pseudoclavibacter endophyticus]|nr:hypothetical protein [Pseudoclavibacter endophyticus]